jgi:hypothetical protein
MLVTSGTLGKQTPWYYSSWCTFADGGCYLTLPPYQEAPTLCFGEALGVTRFLVWNLHVLRRSEHKKPSPRNVQVPHLVHKA